MKRKIYWILSVAVIGSLLWLLFSTRIPFVWQPTFDHNSKQPFGAALFDSLMSSSLPKGYEVRPDLTDSLNPKEDAILYCKQTIGEYRRGFSNYDSEVERGRKIMDYVKRGGQVIVATASLNRYGSDSLLHVYDLKYSIDRLITIDGNKFKERILQHEDIWEAKIDKSHSVSDLIRNISSDALHPVIDSLKKGLPIPKDTLTWLSGQNCYVLSPLYTAGSELYNLCTSRHEALMTYRFRHWHEEALAFRAQYQGGGSITFVSTPLLFSNYAVMDPVAIQLTQRLLSPVRDKHLVRIVGRNMPDKVKVMANKDEFSFIRQRPALRYAFYLLLAVLVLAFINYSRRRIRAIPLLPEEKNVTFEFARFMGTFHYRRHDYKQVVLSQYETMLHLLGESMVRDVNRLNSTELKETIVDKTHLPPADVGLLIRTVMKLQNTDETIDQQDMMKLLDIIRKIKEHFTL